MHKLFTFIFILICASVSVFGQIQNPKVRWKFKTQGTIRGTAVTMGDRIFFGSSDGHIYALDKSTGNQIWKFKTEGAVSATPSVTSSHLIFTSRDNNVYALNPTSGQLLWKFQMQPLIDAYWTWEYFTATPVVSGNVVYVGSGDSYLYALSTNQGKQLWKFKTNGRITAAPLVKGNTIYQPSNDGVVYVLNTDSGKLQWKFDTEGASLDSRKFGYDRTCIFAQPLLSDSLLVIASRDGKTYGVDIYSHKEKWRFTYGPTWAMATSLQDKTVYVGWSTNDHLCALDVNTGKEKWKFVAKGVVYTKPLILSKEVIAGSSDEHVYAVNKKTGEKVWEYKTDAPVFSSPIIDSNVIYFGCDDGNMYALEEGAKPIKVVYAPVPGRFDFTVDSKIAPYLKTRGFTQLDSAGLVKFVNNRINDAAPSVIVMGYDQFPSNLIGDNPESGPIRKYLEAGGKILWFGNIPNYFSFDSNGKFTINLDVPNKLLGVEYIRIEESGNYHSTSTQEGMNYGMSTWFTSTYANITDKDIVPLAYDEHHRVSAWIKKFNSRPGSGFVSCRMWAWDAPLRDDHLELIYKLAMYQLE